MKRVLPLIFLSLVQASAVESDVIVGGTYSDTNYNTMEKSDTFTTTLQADLYRGDLSAQILTSYFRSEDTNMSNSGWGDTQLGLYLMTRPSSSLTLQPGFGIILPTYNSGYNNEAVDVFGSLYAQYDLDKHYYVFGGFTYTIINDKDVQDVTRYRHSSFIVGDSIQYRNTSSFTAGTAYKTNNNGYVNIAYTQTQSIYSGVESFKILSLNGMMPLDTHWFVLGNYRHGLSDSASDNEIALRIGYSF
ncbi:MAG: DUF3187 domain-containing protein [Sulfuricurvum sp.]|jgi:hypothetical protein